MSLPSCRGPVGDQWAVVEAGMPCTRIATNISDLELEARDAADVKYQSDVGDRG